MLGSLSTPVDTGDFRSLLFQSPKTPSASSSLFQSTHLATSFDGEGLGSRKRLRDDSIDASPFNSPAYDWTSVNNTPGYFSPAPLANSRYRLASGLDTPTASLSSAFERVSTNSITPEIYRRGRQWNIAGSTTPESYFPHTSSALAREANGRGRGGSQTSVARRNGWGKAVVSAFGGVAGKLWQFCTAGTFRGFYAGGGPGYAMEDSLPHTSSVQSSVWENVEENNRRYTDSTATNLPGAFPELELIPDYLSYEDRTPTRPAKRIQRDGDWVILNQEALTRESNPSCAPLRPTLPASTPSARPTRPSPYKRPALHHARSSYAGCPSLRLADLQKASSASVRSPSSTPTNLNRPSSRQNSSPPKHVVESPMSPEAQKFVAKLRRKEAEEDREMTRLNAKLQAMIREGKEALGTKIEVEDYYEDDGDDD
ncbi:MAG: hypothetical protein MMC33_004405 [Icmadophila ericetorum]|nr:hypothetical protein [Icmadophila ericetorum]